MTPVYETWGAMLYWMTGSGCLVTTLCCWTLGYLTQLRTDFISGPIYFSSRIYWFLISLLRQRMKRNWQKPYQKISPKLLPMILFLSKCWAYLKATCLSVNGSLSSHSLYGSTLGFYLYSGSSITSSSSIGSCLWCSWCPWWEWCPLWWPQSSILLITGLAGNPSIGI